MPIRSIMDWIGRKPSPLVEADARSLIEDYGDQAYGVARWRALQIDRGKVIDDSRPPAHWHAVRRRVAKLTGYVAGIDNATRRAL